jgi:hypothetical protein
MAGLGVLAAFAQRVQAMAGPAAPEVQAALAE